MVALTAQVTFIARRRRLAVQGKRAGLFDQFLRRFIDLKSQSKKVSDFYRQSFLIIGKLLAMDTCQVHGHNQLKDSVNLWTHSARELVDTFNSWKHFNSWTHSTHGQTQTLGHTQVITTNNSCRTLLMDRPNTWTHSSHGHALTQRHTQLMDTINSWTHFNSWTHSTLEHIELGHTQLKDTPNDHGYTYLMTTYNSRHTQLMALNSWIHPTHRHTQPMDTSDSRTQSTNGSLISWTHLTHRHAQLTDTPISLSLQNGREPNIQ
jgi:hypothetical protein